MYPLQAHRHGTAACSANGSERAAGAVRPPPPASAAAAGPIAGATAGSRLPQCSFSRCRKPTLHPQRAGISALRLPVDGRTAAGRRRCLLTEWNATCTSRCRPAWAWRQSAASQIIGPSAHSAQPGHHQLTSTTAAAAGWSGRSTTPAPGPSSSTRPRPERLVEAVAPLFPYPELRLRLETVRGAI
jgi:hypothetical protein